MLRRVCVGLSPGGSPTGCKEHILIWILRTYFHSHPPTVLAVAADAYGLYIVPSRTQYACAPVYVFSSVPAFFLPDAAVNTGCTRDDCKIVINQTFLQHYCCAYSTAAALSDVGSVSPIIMDVPVPGATSLLRHICAFDSLSALSTAIIETGANATIPQHEYGDAHTCS